MGLLMMRVNEEDGYVEGEGHNSMNKKERRKRP
jgi:hypothetical protein